MSGHITPKGFTSADIQAAIDEAAAAPSPWDETKSGSLYWPVSLVPAGVIITGVRHAEARRQT